MSPRRGTNPSAATSDDARPRKYGSALVGASALLFTAWLCLHGRLGEFEANEAHRFTAKAMLTGTLRLRSMVTLAAHDEQVHGGAVYTNWGFGVPLLQLPFHALATATHAFQGFFPDRGIYFFYLAVAMPIVWAAFDRLFTMQWPAASPGLRRTASWAATWMVLQVTLFPLMSKRFVVYEETLSYFTLCELAALSAYIFALRAWSLGPVCAMGVAAGMGLLVRPTGLVYLGVWGAVVALEARAKRALALAAVMAPFLAFWLFGNFVRTGSVFSLGYENSNPDWEYETPLLRFGATCTDSAWHALEAAGRLFGAFFFYVAREPHDPWMKTCHFDFEKRDRLPDPFFGPWVLALLAGMAFRLVARHRGRRLSVSLPYALPYAGIVLLFVAFVRRGEGFAWRYVGDFWPLIVLAAVKYVHARAPDGRKPLDARLAMTFFAAGLVAMARFFPWRPEDRRDVLTPQGDGLTPHGRETMAADFAASRWGVDPPMASRIACSDRPRLPYHNALGWRLGSEDGCGVGVFTNVYLGVAAKPNDRYALRLATDGMSAPSVSVYLNGEAYTAWKHGESYDADVTLHYRELESPIVMATVLWTHETDPPAGKLLSIELV
jgi:hypothetical protein